MAFDYWLWFGNFDYDSFGRREIAPPKSLPSDVHGNGFFHTYTLVSLPRIKYDYMKRVVTFSSGLKDDSHYFRRQTWIMGDQFAFLRRFSK